MDHLVSPEDEADVIEQLFFAARRLAPTFRSAKDRLQTIELIRKIVYRVVIYPDKVEVLLRKQNLRQLLGQKSSSAVTDLIRLVINARLGRRGGDVRLVVALDRVLDGAEPAPPEYQSQPLLKALARAQDWHERLVTGRASGPRAIAVQTGLDEGYVRRILTGDRCVSKPFWAQFQETSLLFSLLAGNLGRRRVRRRLRSPPRSLTAPELSAEVR